MARKAKKDYKAEFITRLEKEQKDLEKKIDSLETFLQLPTFHNNLSDYHKSLLVQQFNSMVQYNNILCARLDDLNQPPRINWNLSTSDLKFDINALRDIQYPDMSYNEYLQKYSNDSMKSSCRELHDRIKDMQNANIKK